MHRSLQFGMRENPASDRRHGSRSAVGGTVKKGFISDEGRVASEPPRDRNRPPVGDDGYTHAASPRTVAVEKGSGEGGSFVVASAPMPVQKLAQGFEPLIASPEAAKLLGNIHVKTLQRYARRGTVPGYQIGGHWYFRASELDSWLRSQLNSCCHPCRSN